MRKPVYLDCHATTPVDERVLRRMLPYFGEAFGNAASAHRFGWDALAAVELARRQVAALAGVEPKEVVFTSGATESDNLAIKGAIGAAGGGGHIVTVASEHRAVLDSVRSLEQSGCAATVLPPREDGRVDLESLRNAIRPDTVVVSVMYANNETGVIQPMEEIGAICREKGVLFHSDAVQAFGRIPLSMERDGIDLMSVTAHKMYGPKGAGALVVRRRARLVAQMDGGGHESGMRSGTLNVPGIAGFGEACALAAECMAEESTRIAALRDRLLAALRRGIAGMHVNGSLAHRLPGNLNVSFEGVEGDALMVAMPDLALSAASACGAHGPAGSHVLEAIGVPRELQQSALRFGLGRFTTEEEVDYAAARVIETVQKLRAERP
ncbi:MAG: cysteine desulfurase [Acidobacteria bacterium]|nr:cysteine desulfurase [Acidobacteriota bacterium]